MWHGVAPTTTKPRAQDRTHSEVLVPAEDGGKRLHSAPGSDARTGKNGGNRTPTTNGHYPFAVGRLEQGNLHQTASPP